MREFSTPPPQSTLLHLLNTQLSSNCVPVTPDCYLLPMSIKNKSRRAIPQSSSSQPSWFVAHALGQRPSRTSLVLAQGYRWVTCFSVMVSDFLEPWSSALWNKLSGLNITANANLLAQAPKHNICLFDPPFPLCSRPCLIPTTLHVSFGSSS